MKDLIPIQSPKPATLFAPGGLDPIISAIETEARSHVPDIRTKKGRDAIASNAAKVARSKTYLDGLGKEYVAELKALPAKVDAVRRDMRDRLDALKDEVRRPLTDWEEAERAKAEEEAERLRAEEEARQAAIAAELEALRREKAEREAKDAAERKEREARIAAEAVERERMRAETQARAEAEERELQAQAADQARIDAERRAAEAERRAADREHRAAINREILADMIAAGIEEGCAKAVITACAKGQIRHLSVSY